MNKKKLKQVINDFYFRKGFAVSPLLTSELADMLLNYLNTQETFIGDNLNTYTFTGTLTKQQ